jgi:hypothetical protein
MWSTNEKFGNVETFAGPQKTFRTFKSTFFGRLAVLCSNKAVSRSQPSLRLCTNQGVTDAEWNADSTMTLLGRGGGARGVGKSGIGFAGLRARQHAPAACGERAASTTACAPLRRVCVREQRAAYL